MFIKVKKKELTYLIEAVLCVTTTPDSKYIISGGQDRSVVILDIELKKKIHVFRYVHASKRVF
mgnify:CR=1 FL=1